MIEKVIVKDWKDSPMADLYQMQRDCKHNLVRDGGHGEEADTLICNTCKCRWSEGDTKEHFACHCQFHGPHTGSVNYTGLSWQDVLEMFERQKSIDALAGAAVPATVN